MSISSSNAFQSTALGDDADFFDSLNQWSLALRDGGPENFKLIFGIDFTRSNEWTGESSFDKKCLHHVGLGGPTNPYEQAISIIGKTLAPYDGENMIPCFGFGDESTRDRDVFSFYPDERFCHGFEKVLHRYREIVPHVRLAGPTSFAPIIEMATTIVELSGGQYHALVIIADGQVLNPQEQKTVDAIVKASHFPLSIILVGVGDGPWDMMKEFDDSIPTRAFDNFHFVNFTEIMSKDVSPSQKEIEFAFSALRKIPVQYYTAIKLGILGNQVVKSVKRIPLTPPVYGASSLRYSISAATAPSTSTQNNQVFWLCPVCLDKPMDLAFGCGHQVCFSCGELLEKCPICREMVSARVKLIDSAHENQNCPNCLANPKDTVFGCGHQACYECGEDLQTCPTTTCASLIVTKIKLY